jgi:ribonuclease BN (tRNA processing enzyme)
MAPAYFPIPASALSAGLTFHGLAGGAWEGDGYVVRTMRVRHPSVTVAYRVEVGGRVLTYAPDNELAGDHYPVGEGWREEFDAFVRGSDVLIHDAMYTDEEYAARKGWGHSTINQATDLAIRTEVPQLVLFHHAPERSDDSLSRLVEDTRQRVEGLGHGLRLGAAREGVDISIGSAEGGGV